MLQGYIKLSIKATGVVTSAISTIYFTSHIYVFFFVKLLQVIDYGVAGLALPHNELEMVSFLLLYLKQYTIESK